MSNPHKPNTSSGGTPALDPERDTDAIPRPANELDGDHFEGETLEDEEI